MWTSLTRTDDLSKVSIFMHQPHELNALCQSRIKLYFKIKLDGYKNQDRNTNRSFKEEEFVDKEWIVKKLDEGGSTCPKCRKVFDIVLDGDGQVHCDLTVQRENNRLAHIKENCSLLCLQCNRTLK